MRQHPHLTTFGALLLLGTGVALLWYLGSGPRLSWALPPELAVAPLPQQQLAVNQAQNLEFSGQGLHDDTRAWLVPELTDRQSLLATMQTWGSPQHLILHDHYAYLANSTAGLVILDIAEAGHPQIVASLDLPGQSLHLALAFPLLYVAAGNQGLQVLDVSVASAPKLLRSVATNGSALALALAPESRQLFLACGKAGLQTFSLAVPAQPQALGTLAFPGLVLDLASDHDRLLVALGQEGIALLSTATDTLPRERCRLPLDGDARTVCWQHGRAVVASTLGNTRESGILTLCSVERGPRFVTVDSAPFPGAPNDLLSSSSGDELFVAAGRDGLHHFTVTDTTLQRQHSYASLGFIRSATVAPPYLWIAQGEGEVLSLDYTQPPQPLPVLTHLAGNKTIPPLTDGTTLIICTPGNVLEIYDLTDPATPRLSARFTPPGAIQTLVFRDKRLLLGMVTPDPSAAGIVWVIATDPTPSLVTEIPLTAIPTALCSNADWLAVATDDPTTARQQLWIFPLGPTARPVPQPLPLAKAVSALASVGNNLYVLDKETLAAFDLSTPTQPRRGDVAAIPWLLNPPRDQENFALLIHRDIAYVASRHAGIKTFSLAAPQQPAFLGVIETNDILNHLSLYQDQLYLSLRDHGLQLIDISDGEHPTILGTQPLPTKGSYVVAAANSLWLANSSRDRLIGVPLPQQLPLAADGTGTRLRLTVPAQSTPGLYGLWFQRHEQRTTLSGCCSVLAPTANHPD